MRSGRRSRLNALRLLLSALQRAERQGPRGSFSDADALAVLRRERKQRLEAAEQYRAAGQEQRAAAEEADVPVIDEFLPAPLSEAELRELVEGAIADTGAAGMRDMGRVMSAVSERSDGRADSRTAAAMVRERLSGP
jgi:uncharacterized protein